MSSSNTQYPLEEEARRYLDGLAPALDQLGIPGSSLEQRLQTLYLVIESLSHLEAGDLSATWPRFSEMLFHPLTTLLSHPGQPEPSPRMIFDARARPLPRGELEQLPCSLSSTEARAAIVRDMLPEGARCLLLGDDDLVSLALTDSALQLTVLDADARLLLHLQDKQARARLVQVDLSDSLPADLTEAFDAVVTDPPWAAAGMRCFLDAALLALKPTGHLFLSTQPVMLEEPEEAYPRLPRAGLQQIEKWPNLNRYACPKNHIEHVVLQLARLGMEPSLSRPLFDYPFLYSDFTTWTRS